MESSTTDIPSAYFPDLVPCNFPKMKLRRSDGIEKIQEQWQAVLVHRKRLSEYLPELEKKTLGAVHNCGDYFEGDSKSERCFEKLKSLTTSFSS